MDDERREKMTPKELLMEKLRGVYGVSLMDDLFRMFPNLRMDSFPPGCLTISGAFALALGILFLLSAFLNVVLPHYERVEYSVQTRCQITESKEDELIDERLMHMKVKFPLPGIPGLMDGELLCYGSQACADYEVGSVHDCFFDTEDHTLNFYTTMSGHHTVRFFSYVILCIPLLIGAACCLAPASQHWRWQLAEIKREAKGLYYKARLDGTEALERDREEERRRAWERQEMEYGGGYQNSHGGEGGESTRRSGDEEEGGVGGGVKSGVNWLRMQMGV